MSPLAKTFILQLQHVWLQARVKQHRVGPAGRTRGIPIATVSQDTIYHNYFKLLHSCWARLHSDLKEVRSPPKPPPSLRLSLFPPPPPSRNFLPIVSVRRIMPHLQSLNRGWLLQGSTATVAKAAPGLPTSPSMLGQVWLSRLPKDNLMQSAGDRFV